MAGLVDFLINANPSISGTNVGEFNDLLAKIAEVAQLLLYVIYFALGLLLVIKGALLGMQIVKAADEPQVRQEKIGSLKWLVIGVAIAYGISLVAQVLVSWMYKEFAAPKTGA